MTAAILDPEVQDVLDDIVELGYLSVLNGKIVELIPPKINVARKRWTPTINFIRDYAERHNSWEGEFFVCIYDGWREYSSYADERARKYVPWSYLDRSKFLGVGIANEPRFRHRHEDTTIYPEMPRKVMAYDRHVNDRNVLLIPDAEFLATRFAAHLQYVKNGAIPWEQKVSKVIWRGSPLILNGNSFYDYEWDPKRQRDLAVSCSTKPEFRSLLDASYIPTPISWMLKHKYLLDIDGTVNAWSALYWKMSSNSLVWKMRTHWEQWYYNMLIPNQHYVPLADFFQMSELFHWCENNQPTCLAIVNEANSLMKRLTYELSITEYQLH